MFKIFPVKGDFRTLTRRNPAAQNLFTTSAPVSSFSLSYFSRSFSLRYLPVTRVFSSSLLVLLALLLTFSFVFSFGSVPTASALSSEKLESQIQTQTPLKIETSSETETADRESILFIGTTGVGPNDLNIVGTELESLLQGYSFAALSPRSVNPRTCPSEGWMLLRVNGDVYDRISTDEGFRVTSDVCSPVTLNRVTERFLTEPITAQVEGFREHIEDISWPELSEGSSPFSSSSLAIGLNAALPLADETGTVAQWLPYPSDLLQSAPESTRTHLVDIFNGAAGDIFVDIGSVRGRNELLTVLPGLSRVQAELANVLAANARSEVPRKVIIASLADQWNQAQLHFFATDIITPESLDTSENSDLTQSPNGSENPAAGVLVSETTRATGFITITDVRNLLMGDISAFTSQPKLQISQALAEIKDFTAHSYAARNASSFWYTSFNIIVISAVLAFAALYLIRPASSAGKKSNVVDENLASAGVELDDIEKNPVVAEEKQSTISNGLTRTRGKWSAPNWLWKVLAFWATFAFAWVPAALILNLFPWWQISQERPEVEYYAVGFTALIALTLTVIVRLTKHPVSLLAAIAFTVLGVDIILGSLHQRNGFMGSLVLTSRRYYGISNRTYLILIAAGLLLLLPIIARYYRRRAALFAVFSVGLLALAIDALPKWGADFGGPPGIIAAFGLVGLLAAGIKLRIWHLLPWIFVSVATMALVGWLDSRGSANSHIGRFWSSLGSSESFALIAGKIRDVLRSFTGRPDILILLAALVVVAITLYFGARWLNRRSGEHLNAIVEATSAPGFLAVALGILVGVAIAVPVNDSGAIMLKEMFYIASPALVALMSDQIVKKRSN